MAPIRRLLLVDDDRALCAILSMALQEEGYAVSAVHDGTSGLKTVEREPPDLLIWMC